MMKLEEESEADIIKKLKERKAAKRKESKHREIIAPSEPAKPQKQKKDPRAKSPEMEEVDEYMDDFEDFEDEEEQPPPPPVKHNVLRPTSAAKRPGSHKAAPQVKVDVNEIKQALEQENRTAIKNEPVFERGQMDQFSPSKLNDFYEAPTGPNVTVTTSDVKALDFGTIKRQEQRNKDLLDVVTREKENFDNIFEMFPMTAYDQFTKKVGAEVYRNFATQWNDDDVDRETQTNDIETTDQSAQWPDDIGVVNKSKKVDDTVGLSKFLKRIVPVFDVLLDENLTVAGNRVRIKNREENYSITQFDIPAALVDMYGEEPVSGDISFFPKKHNYIAVAYNFPDQGLIIIWDIHHTRKPYKTLKCLSPITCLCVINENLVVAGTKFGSVCIWDLREAGNLHEIYRKSKDVKFVLRHPTYTTDSACRESHAAQLSKIVHIHSWLVSLDEASNIITWSIIELPSGDLAGSEIDLGLRVGGKVKLVMHSQIDLAVQKTFKIKTSEMSCFAVDFGDQQNYFVGNGKNLYHGSVYGGAAAPKRYEENSSSTATTLEMSPHDDFAYMLVGYSCGSINLYDKRYGSPITSWLNSCGSLIKIRWDPKGRPVFYTVDSDKNFMMWDMSKDVTGPVTTISLSKFEKWDALDLAGPMTAKQSPLVAFVSGRQVSVLSMDCPVSPVKEFEEAIANLPSNYNVALNF